MVPFNLSARRTLLARRKYTDRYIPTIAFIDVERENCNMNEERVDSYLVLEPDSVEMRLLDDVVEQMRFLGSSLDFYLPR